MVMSGQISVTIHVSQVDSHIMDCLIHISIFIYEGWCEMRFRIELIELILLYGWANPLVICLMYISTRTSNHHEDHI